VGANPEESGREQALGIEFDEFVLECRDKANRARDLRRQKALLDGHHGHCMLSYGNHNCTCPVGAK
jgi:hypothetical protein